MSGRNRYRKLLHITGRRPDVRGLPVDEDVNREIRVHIEQKTEELISEGRDPEDARREALRLFGDREQIRDECRDLAESMDKRLHLAHLLDVLRQDLRLTIRTIVRGPGFALAAILILGIGTGATTTIFSVVDTVLLRPLPYPDPGRLVNFDRGSHSPPDFIAWRDNISSLKAVGAAWSESVDMTGAGEPERVSAVRVAGEFHEILGARAWRGRLFSGDDFTGVPAVAVLDFRYWQNRWAGDISLLGRQITVKGWSVTVVGIMDPDFDPPNVLSGAGVGIWLPLDVEDPGIHDRGLKVLEVVGRLEEGATRRSAQQEVNALTASLAEEYPGSYTRWDGSLHQFPLISLYEAEVRGIAFRLIVLFGAVGFMLAIACANVANLFLARGTARIREIAMRAALGAGRGRIIAQLLTESVSLALAGGALGILLAHLGCGLFSHYDPGTIPRLQDLSLNPGVLGFAFVVSAATGIVCGLIPAVVIVSRNTGKLLGEGGSSQVTTRQGGRLRSGLVVAEIALALILLVSGGLLFRSFLEMTRMDPGFEVEDLLTVPLTLGPRYSVEDRNQFAENVVERVARIPGVESVATIPIYPFQFCGPARVGWYAEIRNPEDPLDTEPAGSILHPISHDYFKTLGAEVSFGREFTPSEGRGNRMVAIINERIALRLFRTGDVVGRTIWVNRDRAEFSVVGVVKGLSHWGIGQGVDYGVYIPNPPWANFMEPFTLLVRSRADLNSLAPALRQAVWSLDPDLPVDEIVPMSDRISDSLVMPHFLYILFLTFASVALVLAAGGIYSSMLYWVGQRRREMGVRLALGADRTMVVGHVLRHGLILTSIGICIGIFGAVTLAQSLRRLLWGVTASDILTLVVVSLILAATALCACWIPAWRASRADPMEIMKVE